MPHIRHADVVLPVEILFEGEDDDHVIDIAGDLVHAPAMPRPHLRRDEIDDFEPDLSGAPRHPEVESGIVDQQNRVGPFLFDRGDEVAEDPPEHAEVQQHVEEPHEAEVSGVVEQIHALFSQKIAADAEDVKIGSELPELVDDAGGVQIARCLSCNHGDLHRRGNGYIAHPRAMPPAKRERNTKRKKRIRSLRSCFQSSVKNAAVASA